MTGNPAAVLSGRHVESWTNPNGAGK